LASDDQENGGVELLVELLPQVQKQVVLAVAWQQPQVLKQERMGVAWQQPLVLQQERM
jgi:hypothetical protein